MESAYEVCCCHVHCIRLDNGSAWYGGAWGAAILDTASPESCIAVVHACIALGSKREGIDHRRCMHILSKGLQVGFAMESIACIAYHAYEMDDVALMRHMTTLIILFPSISFLHNLPIFPTTIHIYSHFHVPTTIALVQRWPSIRASHVTMPNINAPFC